VVVWEAWAVEAVAEAAAAAVVVVVGKEVMEAWVGVRVGRVVVQVLAAGMGEWVAAEGARAEEEAGEAAAAAAADSGGRKQNRRRTRSEDATLRLCEPARRAVLGADRFRGRSC
jgi:hypothetical protein